MDALCYLSQRFPILTIPSRTRTLKGMYLRDPLRHCINEDRPYFEGEHEKAKVWVIPHIQRGEGRFRVGWEAVAEDYFEVMSRNTQSGSRSPQRAIFCPCFLRAQRLLLPLQLSFEVAS